MQQMQQSDNNKYKKKKKQNNDNIHRGREKKIHNEKSKSKLGDRHHAIDNFILMFRSFF